MYGALKWKLPNKMGQLRILDQALALAYFTEQP